MLTNNFSNSTQSAKSEELSLLERKLVAFKSLIQYFVSEVFLMQYSSLKQNPVCFVLVQPQQHLHRYLYRYEVIALKEHILS